MSAKQDAQELALRKLASRDRTEMEIREYLKNFNVDNEEINEAIIYLKNCGYIDDERYCMKYYEYARTKNKASYRILSELKQKGISTDYAKAVIEKMKDDAQYSETIVDDRTAALNVGIKMDRERRESGKAADEKFYARVGRRLMTLGYNSGICYYVIGRIRSRLSDDE